MAREGTAPQLGGGDLRGGVATSISGETLVASLLGFHGNWHGRHTPLLLILLAISCQHSLMTTRHQRADL